MSVAEDILTRYGSSLNEDKRQELIEHILANKVLALGPMQPRMPSELDNLYAGARHMVDYSRAGMGGPKEWLTHMAESMDAIKEVMTFLAAQEAMELFGTNKKAQQLYMEIIQAGIAHVFHRRDMKTGDML